VLFLRLFLPYPVSDVVCHSQLRNGTRQPPALARQMTVMQQDSAA